MDSDIVVEQKHEIYCLTFNIYRQVFVCRLYNILVYLFNNVNLCNNQFSNFNADGYNHNQNSWIIGLKYIRIL